jgi:hypothetical protein
MQKRTRNRFRRLEERMLEIESGQHTMHVRIGHLAQHRHEHWAKIRELDIRTSALEGNPPSDWNYGTSWVRVGAGPKPSKRSLRKAAKRVADAIRANFRMEPTAEQRARREAEVEALLREHRLRDAHPADVAKAEAIADEVFGEDTTDD